MSLPLEDNQPSRFKLDTERRQGDLMILQQLRFLQDTMTGLCEDVRRIETRLDSRIGDAEKEIKELNSTIIEWRTERNIVLKSASVVSKNARVMLLALVGSGGSLAVFYDDLKEVVAHLLNSGAPPGG